MKFRLTGEFSELSEVRGMRPHTGIDLGMPENTKLRSLFDGEVENIYDHGAIGNGVKIHTEDGSHIIYGHMNKVDLKIGDHVNAGDLIGLSGNTGNSTGPHLHFGVQNDKGQFINPTKYAERVSNMSGDNPIIRNIFKPTNPIGDHIIGKVKDKLREETANKTISIIMGILDGVSDVLVEVIGAVSLLGCTILIIMKVAGYSKGYKQAGMLFVLNMLVKMCLGGK
jgi:hypothetical protein